jgi:alkylated DNA repair dioxygenase AlkB
VLDLFAPTLLQPIVDDQGGVRYWPGFADGGEADAWFQTLRTDAHWHAERRKMYDRIVDVPRLLAAYRIDALPTGLPLAEMLARVKFVVPAPYNAIGLNFYRDGRDSVAMHNDKLHTIVPGQPIALVSLGSPRRMAVRAKAGDRRSIAIDLAPGSLFAMSHASQLTHEHGIPKTTHNPGPRISVVFRVRPEGWTADY